jgi:hypothetical protein
MKGHSLLAALHHLGLRGEHPIALRSFRGDQDCRWSVVRVGESSYVRALFAALGGETTDDNYVEMVRGTALES